MRTATLFWFLISLITVPARAADYCESHPKDPKCIEQTKEKEKKKAARVAAEKKFMEKFEKAHPDLSSGGYILEKAYTLLEAKNAKLSADLEKCTTRSSGITGENPPITNNPVKTLNAPLDGFMQPKIDPGAEDTSSAYAK